MKRLHIVGKSKDNKRLLLAKTRGAKFGSFEIPIGQKLLKLVREVDEARGGGRPASAEAGAKEPASAGGSPEVPAGTARTPAAAAAATSADEGRDPAIDLPIGARRAGGRTERTGAARGDTASTASAAAGKTTATPDADEAAAEPPREPARTRIQPRRTRPDIPARSNLSPAEIQTLIRAGRSIRTVAQLAGTSTAWIRWLAEPVEQERMGVVAQALRLRQRRARLGQSALALGDAVVQNLRRRGMAAPDRILEEGFSAARDGSRWAVRLTYEHRGRRLNAQWEFDPQSRDLVPLNDLATQLGWVDPAAGNGLEPDEAPAARPPRRRRSRSSSRNGRASSSRSAAARRSTARGSTRKSTSVRSSRAKPSRGSGRSRRR